MTLFEHPLNERVRTFLRLEHLFEKLDYFSESDSPWATRAIFEALLDILSITARSDIKGELTKELDRNAASLGRVRDQPGVDARMLDQVLAQLTQASARIGRIDGQIGSAARETPVLKAISQRSSIPGGACSFDLPQYHYLINQAAEARDKVLDGWTTELAPAKEAIALVLSLARSSNNPRSVSAREGFFQETLDASAPAQLIRVELASDLGCFPEISGHRNRFSIRFMHAEGAARPAQTAEDIAFKLTCCVF